MHTKTQNLFYSLSIFLLFTALFLLQQNKIDEVTVLQDQIKQQFSVAWEQTLGDQSYFTPFEMVLEAVDDFYAQATASAIVLLNPRNADDDMIYVFGHVYNNFAAVFTPPKPKIAGEIIDRTTIVPANFMTTKPIYNIVPEDYITRNIYHVTSAVSGEILETKNTQIWATMQDGVTGQIYCVAIFNGETNKYLGECKRDYY